MASPRIVSTLQGIVGRVLRIDPGQIDPDAPFLELGADSLALVEALRGLQEAFGVKLTIRQLFEQLPTVSALAAYLEGVAPEAATARPDPHPPAPSPAPSCPLPGRGGEQQTAPAVLPSIVPIRAVAPVAGAPGMERVFGMQIQAFYQLVAQQLQMLGARGSAPVVSPAPPPVPVEKPAEALKPVLPTYLGKARPAAEMNERQRRHLDALIERYCRKTAKSKELTQRYRSVLADSRAAVGFRGQVKEMLYPLARARSSGSRIWDVDGNSYVDITMGMGVHLFGHDPEFLRETIASQVREGFELGPRSAHSGEVAALFCELTGMERATFTNSGTEACMTAIRLARARTGRSRIAMFAGSYHGHSDGTLAQTQEIDGELRSFPVAPGIPPKVAEDVLVLDYGTPRALEVIRQYRDELAAVFVEPIQSRRPDLQPRGFLHELRALTAECGIALIFDEMICGFRLHLGGAQAWFGIRADLATYGKIVGGGLPIGVVAGSAEYMDGIDGGFWQYGDGSRPERETTFFGGTFCQHPLAMAAARTVLTHLKEQGPGLQEDLNARTARFADRLNAFFEADGAPIRTVSAHSLFRFNFAANAELLYYHLVEKGVYVWEWRNNFLSTAHTDEDLDFVARAVEESVHELRQGGFLPEPPKASPGEPSKMAFWDRHGKPAIAPVGTAPAAEPVPVADRAVQFSLYFFGNYGAEFSSSKYGLILDCARFADRHGFAALWFPERHFHAFGGLSPNPSVLAAALARETERIALRAGSVVLPLHHPLRVAEEWALVDNLSGGRVGLSYASGWHPNDFALAPEAYGRHRELMFERIETVEKLWRGEAIRVADGAGKEVDLRVFPQPARRDLPGWITIVNNLDTYRRAGAIGAGVLTNLMGQTVEGLAEALAVYREALAAAGHPPEASRVTLLLHTFLDGDAEAAIAKARRPFYDYLKSSVGLLKNMMASEGMTVDFDSLSEEDLDYMLELAYQRYVRTSALIGSPEACAPIVERLRAIGVDEIACLVDFGVDPESVGASLPWLDALRQSFARPAAAPDTAPPPPFPLTEAQSDLYTVAQMGEEALMAYNEAGVLELRGPLDLGILRAALEREVDRHEALRTLFPSPGEEQVVQASLHLDVPLVDASGLPRDLREEAVSRLLESQARHPFDLARGPLVRAAVLRLEERIHLLTISVHHIAADGLSIGILLGEAFASYEAERAGTRAVLPPPFQFREYAAWLAGPENPEADEAYWLARFAGPLPVFEPPLDRPRPPLVTFGGRRQRAVFNADFRRRITQLGRRHGATFYIALLAAWTAVLHRWTGQDDLVVGGPTARRPLEGGDRLVGHCVDLVPLRSQADPLRSFVTHLAAVRSLVLDAHDHGGYSFSRLVRALNPPRDPARPALVNTVFNLDPDWGMGKAGGLDILERSPAMPYVKFDLTLHALETAGALVIYLDSRTGLFDPPTIQRLFGHLETLLEGAMEDPSQPLAGLPLLTAPERHQLTVEMGDTASDYPRDRTIPELFDEAAAATPDAVALEFGDERMTYQELREQAERLARRLPAGERIAVSFGRSPELIVAMLAVLKAGSAYVPLDPTFPEERFNILLADAGATIILTQSSVLEVPAVLVVPSFFPDDLAYVVYTSGSTGTPKGVAVPHRAVIRLVRDTDYVRLTPGDRVAHAAHPAFDATTFEVWGPLLNGARVVGIERDVALSPADFAAEIRDRGITTLFLTTALFNQIVREVPDAFAGVRHLLFGGEAVDPDRVRDVLAAGPPERLLHVYGPTESTTFATWHRVREVPEGTTTVPIGRPIHNTRAVVLDRTGEPVPPGAHGELCLGGDGLAQGYLGRPDLTAERFVPDPFLPGKRLYRTGDRVRTLPDGSLEFLGRLDDQVKIRGFRVEPGEVEAVLASCPGVSACAVVARREGGETRLVAYLAGEAPDAREFLRSRLPEPMVPAAFVVLDVLPLTSTGKIDRRALPAPDWEAPADQPFEPPRSPLEQIVAGAWADVLGRERIGVRDDFFDLGGHSLLAGRVLARLRGALGVDLPLSDFFQDPTVAGLARRIEAARRERGGVALPPIGRAPRDQPLRLSFAQERLWLVDQLQPGSAAYNSFLPTVLTGRLDVPALARVLAEIQRRHEVLRTRFAPRRFAGNEAGPVQVIAPASGLADWFLPLVDLSALPESERPAELRRLTTAEALRPFDLARGPLLRPTLARVDEREHALLLNLHHSVCDGWSLDILTRELGALYRAFSAGKPSPLPELPIQYADFAHWQRHWLQGEVVETQLAWWRRQLGEDPPVLDLPTDRPRPALPSGRGGTRAIGLAPELAGRLQALGRRQGGTLFTTLLAAFQALLGGWAGQDRVSVGTPVANRTRVEIEGLIGFFVNTLVLSTDLAGDPAVRELLDRTRDVTLGAFDHQDLPFERVVAALARNRDASRQPLFQVMFVLQNNPTSRLDLPDLTLSSLPHEGGVTQFDLVLSAMDTPGGLALGIAYASELWDADTIGRLMEQFERLLAAMADDPDGRISELPRFSEGEKHQVTAGPEATLGEDTVRAELERRRERVSSRRGQLSPERRALLQKWVGGKAPEASPSSPPRVDPLVALQPKGSRPPLFLVHPAHGAAHDYLDLSRLLGADQPLYVFQSPGLAGGELFGGLSEMATRYLESVRAVKPQGPYRLGGWCTGGNVAYEMARQLVAQGEEVELLALLDSHAPLPEPAPPADEEEMFAAFVRLFSGDVPTEALRGIPAEERLDQVIAQARAKGALPETFDPEQARRHWRVLESNLRALERYAPAGCQVPTLLFRATVQPPEAEERPALGWDRWIGGPLEVHAVEGDHAAVVHGPGVAEVATLLESGLPLSRNGKMLVPGTPDP